MFIHKKILSQISNELNSLYVGKHVRLIFCKLNTNFVSNDDGIVIKKKLPNRFRVARLLGLPRNCA